MSSTLSVATPDILSIAWALGSRSESWLYDQIAHLVRHKVHVLTYAHLNQEEYPHTPVSLLPPRNAFSPRLRRLFRRALGLWPQALDRREARCLRRLLNGGGFRLVQAHFAWVGMQVQDVVDRSGLPLVVWLYGSDVFRDENSSRLPELLKPGRIFCCISQALKSRVIELGCPAASVHVVYPGISVPASPPDKTAASGHVRIVSVGRLVDFKDPMSMVIIAQALRDRGVRFEWEHLGDGPLRAPTEDAIRRAGLESAFKLRGEVPHAEVVRALRSADIMAHNAVVAPDGGRESFGVVLVEAAAAGLPIVSVDLGGIPEIVCDGVSGYLVEEGDLEGMADRIESLAKDSELRRQMGIAGHAHALESFELTKQVAKLDSLYDKLIAGGRAR